jgi:D-alanyl-D-alanine carboxypeptidase
MALPEPVARRRSPVAGFSTAAWGTLFTVLLLAAPARAVAPADATPAAASPAAPARLPWVNPARCLPSCAFDPGPTLRRLDDRGRASARGKFRVDEAAADALSGLLAAARAAGHTMRISSAYRSYREQTRLFRSIKERGRAARPGHSEHQLGTAIDLRLPSTAAIDWLAEHAFEHGFALSYPPGKQRLTGYRPEPWHVRFVGAPLAGDLHQHGWTLEELFRARPGLGESGDCADCPAALSRRSCGAVTTAGSCQGTVLTWCYDGALAAVDCAVSEQTCAAAPRAEAPADASGAGAAPSPDCQ